MTWNSVVFSSEMGIAEEDKTVTLLNLPHILRAELALYYTRACMTPHRSARIRGVEKYIQWGGDWQRLL